MSTTTTKPADCHVSRCHEPAGFAVTMKPQTGAPIVRAYCVQHAAQRLTITSTTGAQRIGAGR